MARDKRMKVKAALPVQIRGVDMDNRRVQFVASDETVDRYGTVISVKGWDLANYRRNPLFLFGHDYRTPWAVMGRAMRVEKNAENKELLMDVLFMERDINPIADMVYQMYAHKPPFLNAVSVGFVPLKAENVTDEEQDELKQSGPKRKASLRFTQQELLELSAVTVPANPNAVGKDMDEWMTIEAWGKQMGMDPVQVMAARTALQDADERSALEVRAQCWINKSGLMVPCECESGEEMLTVDQFREACLVSTKKWVFASEFRAEVDEVADGFLKRFQDKEERVGAVLNSRNKNNLKQAQELIQRVLNSAEPPPEAGTKEFEEDAITDAERLNLKLDDISEVLEGIFSTVQDIYDTVHREVREPDEEDEEEEPVVGEVEEDGLEKLDAILARVGPRIKIQGDPNEQDARIKRLEGQIENLMTAMKTVGAIKAQLKQ